MRQNTTILRTTCLIFSCILGASAAYAQADGNGIACGSPYVIGRGDSLSSVAKRAYGDPKRYDILFETNRDAIGGDPGNVAVGTSILVPCLDASGQPMAGSASAGANAAIEAAITSEGPLDPDELDALFGPVALFPDPLLTQVLMAATFPLDVVKADRFVKASADLTDKQRADAAEKEPWDPGVRQLAAGFPDLITRMADHIDWTEQAGEAVVAQTEDVLDSIQRLRSKAQENGYLETNEAQAINVVDEQIYIVPANPEIVYVPTYSSQVVYTTPISTSSYYDPYYYGYANDDWTDALAAGAIIFGGALVLDEIFDNNDNLGNWWRDGGSIDWDTGDINIDRGDINIDRGDVSLGNGNINIGDGGRDGIAGVDRPERASTRPGSIGGPEGDALRGAPARNFNPDAASREVARQKIETRKATTTGLGDLPPTRPAAKAPARKSSAGAAATARPSTARPAATSRSSSANVSRPSTTRKPSASTASRSGSSTAFKQSGGSRAAAGASRGRASSSGGGGRRR